MTWDVSNRFALTAGARYYDFSEERRFHSGGLSPQPRRSHRPDRFQGRQPALHRPPGNQPQRRYPRERPGLEGLPPRRRQRSAEPAAVHGRGRGARSAAFQDYDDETLWNYEVGRARPARAVSASTRPPSTPTSATSRSRWTPGPARRASCSTCPRRTRMGVEVELAAEPIEGLDALARRQPWSKREFDSTLPEPLGDVHRPAFAKATACRPCPTSRSRPRRSYSFPVIGQRRGLCRRLVPACRQPVHPAGRPGAPGAGSFNFIFLRSCQRQFRHEPPRISGRLRLPAYDLVNLSGGPWSGTAASGVTLFVNNLFDENAKMSLGLQRGERPRLATTCRPAADHRPDDQAAFRRRSPEGR